MKDAARMIRVLTALFVIGLVSLLALAFQVYDCIGNKDGVPLVGFFNAVCIDKAVVK